MDPNQLQQFRDLLERFLSADNDIRKVAEEAYEQIALSQRAMCLLQISKVPEVEPQSRTMSLVLLRRLLSSNWEELWGEWSEETKAGFKSEILSGLLAEQDGVCRKRFCDVIAEVARGSLDEESEEQKWPEVLKFLFDCASSDSELLKENALIIIESVPGIFGNQLEHYIPVIKDMLQQCMMQQTSKRVRAAAAKATSSFLNDNEADTAMLKSLGDLLPPFLVVCAEHTDSEDDNEIFQCLVDLTGAVPKYLRQRLEDIFVLCIKVLSDKEKDEVLRHTALEALVTWAETAAPMVRKDGQKFIPQLVEQCLALMVDIEEDEEWGFSDEADDDDTDSNSAVGETSLDRLACALGGKAVMTHCLGLIQTMMTQENWQYRHAGLMALSAIGEGCHKQMEPMLSNLVNSILPYFKDPHPRVRYACCNAIGQMSSDFSPNLQKRLHDKVIPAILSTLEDASTPRVQSHAGAALVNFSEDCPKDYIAPYLDSIMMKLGWVLETTFQGSLENGRKGVLEQIITSIASVADTAEERFANYYDKIMHCLKYILQTATQDDMRLLRGKTIECISLVGLAVGQEKFMADANEVMQMLLKAQQAMGSDTLDDDDPQTSYMISAWARICKLLGKDFAQFLPLVMPAVMKTASLKPEVAIVETEDAKSMDNEDDWQFVNLGDQQSFGIKTAGLEDKATACQMIVCYARELKEAFADWVDPVAKLMVPMLKFYFHDGVRMAAAESLPFLMESAKAKGDDFTREMWAYISPELIKAMELDPDSDATAEHMYAMAKCIECLGFGCLNEEQMGEIEKILEKYLKQHFEKQSARIEKRKDEDYDEEVETELNDEDEDDVLILSKISDIMHALFGTHKEAMLPLFDRLLPHFAKLVDDDQPYRNRQWGICCFDDVIEYTGAHSVKYQEVFLRPMLRALEDTEPELRQAAAYGFGVMGMHGGNVYAQACSEALPRLAQMIEAPGSRQTEACTSATENAISAVSKILKSNASMIDTSQVVPRWLQWLPTWEDKDETPYIYGYLADLIESNNPLVTGDNLVGVVRIIAEALNLKAFTESSETEVRLVQILKHIQSNAGEVFQQCVVALTPEQMFALQTAMGAS